MVGRSGVRFHVRVLSLGFWGVLLGAVVLYTTSRALAVVGGASSQPSGAVATPAPTQPWVVAAAQDTLLGVRHVGAGSVLAGVTAVVLGAWLLQSTTRRTP